MDPFVTQIGDVTIKRVAPQNNSPGDEEHDSESQANTTKMEDSSATPETEKDASASDSAYCETVKSSDSAPVDLEGEAKTSREDVGEEKIDEGVKEGNGEVMKKEDEKELEDESKRKIEEETEKKVEGDIEKKIGDDVEKEIEGEIDKDLEKDNGIENESADVKTEYHEKEGDSDNLEDYGVSDKYPEEYDDTRDGEDGEGEMDASQFLEMAQSEAAEEEDGMMDSYTGRKSGGSEEEDGSEGGPSKKSKTNRVIKSEPLGEDETMEEGEDYNGDNYAGQDYEGDEMALDEQRTMKKGDADEDYDGEGGLKFAKKEPREQQDKKVEDEVDDQNDETDIKKKLRTRQKRKILVEDDTDESEEERKKKRKKRKKKGAKGDGSETSEETESEDDGSGKKKKKKKKPARKAKKKDDDDDGSGGDKSEKKTSNMRRNIRDVMDETQLDEATLAAQRQEMERLRRVQEQQRILREAAIQRQQQQRADKVISLLQGNTSILKQVSVGPAQTSKSGSGSSPNTVVVKVGGGATAQSNKKVLELLKIPKGTSAEVKPSVTKILTKPQSLQGATMMTPSVSIAPVRPGAASAQRLSSLVKQPSLIQAQASYSASEGEEEEDEEDEGEGEEEMMDEFDETGKKKKKDVVTISSSSEDDCIVLSEPSDGGEDEEEDDPTNSGMHTNDSFNVPDEEGRVQVNMGKPEGDPDIFLAPHIARIIKPHQVGGIRFLYDNIIESIERFSTSTGFGCILAHSMGLGKTLQVISFCDIFLRHTPAKTVMCIMPINTLQNWLAEFNMWMPDDALATPLAAQGEVRPRTFNIHVLNDSHKTLKARAKVVEDWSTGGGVLLIGYEMYRQLSLKKMSKPKKSRRKKVASDEEELDAEEEEKRQKEILEKVYEALVKPGPDLVICDEGHRIKNSHASISVALKQIRTKRRIVLTGYPLQNNLLEYWCMVDFVRPNYLGTKTEFCNMFERPIQNGQCIDSTPQDIRLMRYRAHVLHSLLEGFVQRRSHAVLQQALPQKEEFVLLVRMTPFQRKLYETFMNEVVRTKAVPNPLKAFAVCCKIWNHPDVLYQFLKKREGGEGVDLDLEEAAAALATNTVIDPTGTPVEERKVAAKTRNRSGASKSRKKKETSSSKPAAAIMPNTSSQSDANNQYGLSGQYPMHGQINSNSMMGSYNPYSAPGQAPYGSFNPPHHYNPSSSYGHAGYSGTSGFSSGSSLNTPAQSSFTGSGSSGYGDSLASSPASQSSQYGSSSSQSLFSGSTPSNPPSAGSSGYSSMSTPYFSSNSPAGQHPMGDGFNSSSNYSQSWSATGSYNSFNQGPSSSQSFSSSNYSSSGQNPPFQGYGAAGSSSSFNQSMYGSASNSSSTNPAQPYQPGLMDQQILDQNLMAPPSRPNLNPNLIPQQSPVNASGMLPGGAPMKNPALKDRNFSAPSNPIDFNPNFIAQHSPLNASGFLPGGAPTKNSSMMPSSMGAGLLGPGMGVGMSSSASSLGGMGETMMGHHSQAMDMSNVYQNPSMMNIQGQHPTQTGQMAGLSAMTSSDVPPSAEDLLRSATDDFRAFDPSIGKSEQGRSMYDVKDRAMFDPWGNTQSYNMMSGQDLKSHHMKKSENDKFNPGPSPINQLKNEMNDVKLEDKPSNEVEVKDMRVDSKSGVNSQTEQDTKGTDSTDSWRVEPMEVAEKDNEVQEESKDKEGKEDEEEGGLAAEGKTSVEAPVVVKPSGKEDPGIPYDWAIELMKDYVPGLIENSAKMALFFCILEEALAIGDRILLFSQSLFTLSLIEDYLQRSFIPVPGVYERWQRNRTYFRLDGSTTAMEREKLINEFNANMNVYLFLVSTRAGSLGINLVGANRVIVFDASWNPCHDTQAVCRVYRYGQKKPCYVYRFVMDNCLEKKIYDRQINKQGMSDRVVDECNPDAHLSIKEVTNLCWDDEKESEIKDLSDEKDNYRDVAMRKIVEKHGKLLTKAPFQHESLLVDRKEKKLSQAEKRLAKRSYEMEKKAANRPVYNYFNPNQGGLQIRPVQRDAHGNIIKPIASVRPMQSELNNTLATGNRNTKWIPAEVWQRQGMSAQEMTLPLDVVIPTNSPERSSIVLKAGQRVMVLKSPKGIYMQLENGKIIAIRTAFKNALGGKTESKPFAQDKDDIKKGLNLGVANKGNIKLTSGIHPLRNNPNITITPRGSPTPIRSGIRPIINRPGMRMQTTANMRPWVRPGGVAGRAVPLRPAQNLRPGLRGLSPSVTVTPANAKSRNLGPVTITPRLAPATNFPGAKPTENMKDKVKTDSKSETKSELSEKFESDDGHSSNSSVDVPSTSSKTSAASDSAPPKTDENFGKEKDKEDLQSNKQVAAAQSAIKTAPDQSKSFENPALPESKSDGLAESPGIGSNQGLQDLSVNSLVDSSSAPMKNFNLSSNNPRQQDLSKMADKRENSGASTPTLNPAPSGSSMYGASSLSKQYSSSTHGGSMMSPPKYNSSADHNVDDSKSSSSIESQWKSSSAPQAFSPGVPKPPPQQRNLQSPAYDDNSEPSNLSAKSSAALGTSLEPRSVSSTDAGHSKYANSDLPSLHSKASNKLPTSSIPPSSSQSSQSSSKLNQPSSSTSSASSSSSNFPPLDPYANLYGSYGAYPGGLPSSNYYNPYSYPPGFLPDPKSSLSKSSTEANQSAAVSTSRSTSKSSSSRSDTKKSHESSRSSVPAAYDSRQPSSSSSTSSTAHTSRSGSSSTSSTSTAASSSAAGSESAAFSSSSSAAAAYNPMMMSPSFNPTSCQYPPPATASGSTNPFTAAAAAAANYPSPYASPYGYPGANQFESDLARAQMYSAFHRPEAGLDPTSPYLALPAHSRPITGAGTSPGSFYSQNVYGGQYGSARDPYSQLPPYPASPLFMPPAPYGGLASSASSTATSDQSPSQ